MCAGKEMDQLVWDLFHEAEIAREHAYDPYTNYLVGAAILGRDGKIYRGCNVGNASAGLGICAERVSIFEMVLAGCRDAQAMLVLTEDGGTPCGACRQVIVEFSTSIPIYLASSSRVIKCVTSDELLPYRFTLT